MRSNSPLSSLALVVALTLFGTGCARWVVDPDQQRISQAVEPGPIRLVTSDGRIFVLKNVVEANDTIKGTTVDDPAAVVALPVSAVKSIERRADAWSRENPNHALLYLVFAGIGALIVALVY